MTWRESIAIKGRFRNVPFYYSTVNGEVGRRTVLQEFPGRDKPYHEDLGRRARRFSFEIYVLGDNYDKERDLLLAALETPGSGELIHPYLGALEVIVDGSVRLRESTDEQGIARFSVSFVEVDPVAVVFEEPVTATIVVDVSDSMISALAQAIEDAVEFVELVEGYAQAAIDTINAVVSAIDEVRGTIAAVVQMVDDLQSAVNDLADSVTSLLALPGDLVRSVQDVFGSVVGAISSVTSAVTGLVDVFDTLGSGSVPAAGVPRFPTTQTEIALSTLATLSTFGDDYDELPENTPQQIQAAENRRQLVRLVKATALGEYAKLTAEIDFESIDQTSALRDALVDLANELLEDATLPDELYVQIANVRSAVVEHLKNAAKSLPELSTYTPNVALPALVISQKLYGTPDREAEILARNPTVRDPTRVPGGVGLRVLLDA